MIRFFHNYNRSVIGILFLIIVAIAMLLFGLPTDGGMRREHAVKIDNKEISLLEFSNRLRNERARLRSIFGQAYNEFAATLEANLPSEMMDRVVAEMLLSNTASNLSLRGGDRQLSAYVSEQMGGFNPEQYRQLLAQVGQTAEQFESHLAEQLAANTFIQLISDLSFATELEALALWKEENLRFDLEYVRIPTEYFADDVVLDDENLQNFYNSRITDYEIPARVSYTFTPVPPSFFEGDFEIFEEDIELFYQDNMRNYRTPESRLIARLVTESRAAIDDEEALQQQFIEKLSTASISSIEELQELLGEDFDVEMFSRITRGELSPREEQAAFRDFEVPQVHILEHSAESGATLLLVLDVEEEGYRPLAEVRDEIEMTLREREAPAFAAAFAADLLGEWEQSGVSLEEFSHDKGLEARSPERMFERSEDPHGFRGLTTALFGRVRDERILITALEHPILVEIREFQSPFFPEFEEVRERVTDDYRVSELDQLTRSYARTLLRMSEEERLQAIEEAGLEIRRSSELSRESFEDILVQQSIRGRVLSFLPSTGWLSEAFPVDEDFVIVAVSAVHYPEEEPDAAELTELKFLAENQTSTEMEQAIIARLKRGAAIDINPAALN